VSLSLLCFLTLLGVADDKWAQLFGRMMRYGMVFDEHVLRAIRRIRAVGRYRVIALTNNFSGLALMDNIPPSELTFLGWEEGPTPPRLRELFDDFCDSSAVGLR
jgi:hypothetical protein